MISTSTPAALRPSVFMALSAEHFPVTRLHRRDQMPNAQIRRGIAKGNGGLALKSSSGPFRDTLW
jgi:hypothetical protein